MVGKYYARKKSSLDGKRVKKDPAFKRTMENAGILGRASKTASSLYRVMTAEQRKSKSFRELTGEVMLLLREGVTEEVIVRMLRAVHEKKKGPMKRMQPKEKEILSFADAVLQRILYTWQSPDAGLPESRTVKEPP